MNLVKNIDGMQQSDIQKMIQEFDRVANYEQRQEKKRLLDKIDFYKQMMRKVAPRKIQLLSQVQKYLQHYRNSYIELLTRTIQESSLQTPREDTA